MTQKNFICFCFIWENRLKLVKLLKWWKLLLYQIMKVRFEINNIERHLSFSYNRYYNPRASTLLLVDICITKYIKFRHQPELLFQVWKYIYIWKNTWNMEFSNYLSKYLRIRPSLTMFVTARNAILKRLKS